MNVFKKINFVILSWAVEALNQNANDQTAPKIDFAVGGQAVIEGVMMRSPSHISIAVRKSDGTIKVRNKPYRTLTQRYKWLNIPIVRGVINLFEMMVVGSEAINYSAGIAAEGGDSLTSNSNEKSNKKSTNANSNQHPTTTHPSLPSQILQTLLYIFSFILALALSIGLFKFIPLWATTYLESQSPYIANHYIIFNLIDGIIKMSIFLSYIFLLGLIPSFHRVFEYHGAEHKSIFNYESKKPLTVANAKKQIRFHPRCGTSFILIVFVISIIVYTFIPKQPDFWINFSVRLAILPFIAGISYEYLKLSAKHAKNAVVKALIAPGLWFQRLTTQEPDEKQLAVGLKSLQEALASEKTL